MEKNVEKTFMAFQKIWFQLVSVYSLYYLGNTRSSRVTLWSNRPKISDLMENNFPELNFSPNHSKVGKKNFFADFRSFWVSLTGSLPKGFQKEALLPN